MAGPYIEVSGKRPPKKPYGSMKVQHGHIAADASPQQVAQQLETAFHPDNVANRPLVAQEFNNNGTRYRITAARDNQGQTIYSMDALEGDRWKYDVKKGGRAEIVDATVNALKNNRDPAAYNTKQSHEYNVNVGGVKYGFKREVMGNKEKFSLTIPEGDHTRTINSLSRQDFAKELAQAGIKGNSLAVIEQQLKMPANSLQGMTTALATPR